MIFNKVLLWKRILSKCLLWYLHNQIKHQISEMNVFSTIRCTLIAQVHSYSGPISSKNYNIYKIMSSKQRFIQYQSLNWCQWIPQCPGQEWLDVQFSLTNKSVYLDRIVHDSLGALSNMVKLIIVYLTQHSFMRFGDNMWNWFSESLRVQRAPRT